MLTLVYPDDTETAPQVRRPGLRSNSYEMAFITRSETLLLLSGGVAGQVRGFALLLAYSSSCPLMYGYTESVAWSNLLFCHILSAFPVDQPTLGIE